MFRKIALLATVLTLSLPATATFARDRGTQGQAGQPQSQDAVDRAACNGDSHRFCKAALGDDMTVLACLQQNRQKLTRACRGVLERNGV